MATISNSTVVLRFYAGSFGSSLKPIEFHPLRCGPTTVSFRAEGKVGMRKSLTVQATSRESDSVDSASVFFGGFLLGGIIMGALGCIYAPQISKAVVGEKAHLLKKLPLFKYNEEKELQKTKKVLREKIIQLNGELDAVTSKLQHFECI